jgi:hypothetical protein
MLENQSEGCSRPQSSVATSVACNNRSSALRKFVSRPARVCGKSNDALRELASAEMRSYPPAIFHNGDRYGKEEGGCGV